MNIKTKTYTDFVTDFRVGEKFVTQCENKKIINRFIKMFAYIYDCENDPYETIKKLIAFDEYFVIDSPYWHKGNDNVTINVGETDKKYYYEIIITKDVITISKLYSYEMINKLDILKAKNMLHI